MLCLLGVGLALLLPAPALGFLPSRDLACGLDPCSYAELDESVKVLRMTLNWVEFDDTTRELVRFKNRMETLDQSSIDYPLLLETRRDIRDAETMLDRRAMDFFVALSRIMTVGTRIQTGPFSAGDRRTGASLVKLAQDLTMLTRAAVGDSDNTASIANYPRYRLRSQLRAQLHVLYRFFDRLDHLRFTKR